MAYSVVVLVSGSGTLLQSLLDSCDDPDWAAAHDVRIVAVGADRDSAYGLERGRAAGVPTFVVPFHKGDDRAAWDRRLTEEVAAYDPDLVVSAGFMKLVGPAFLERFAGRMINTHPALLPSFPGTHGVRDALAYGVKVTGASVFYVDDGVDTGAVIAQAAVPVLPDDTEESLHERIKVQERRLLIETVADLADRAAAAH
ncbi:phosphoribosylglycinamide formyltransferase-1 [Raineyella antarctica]|uniref:Phosphoribosylglycinamide formyltransferase n=1 Tax=Raineyella antarctica TaxID=1577474 RepID=A0A1G6H546_9ACTN|nr:phosphoribosylglycinamide formyltransferase [Raineyella antarctica]SDB89293.1 phosphoribosylglycinamide formyltransferase-1 [Raineyella antarctica]